MTRFVGVGKRGGRSEAAALDDLARELEAAGSSANAEALQTIVYEVGKRHACFPDLKAWFRALYEILLGQSEGPRMGSFIALYGVPETVALIRSAVAGENLAAAEIADPRAMSNFVAAATVAAVTVMQLVQARDGTTAQRLQDAFDPADQPILEALSARLEGKTDRQKNPHAKHSLAFRLDHRPPRRLGRLLRQARSPRHQPRPS